MGWVKITGAEALRMGLGEPDDPMFEINLWPKKKGQKREDKRERTC